MRMSGRRLPLHSPSGPALQPDLVAAAATLRVAGRSLAVADTERGSLAAAFAARLANRLHAEDVQVRVLLTSFDALIDLPASQRAAFHPDVPQHNMALGAGAGLPDDLPGADPTFWLLVGQPALLRFDGTISVLLGAGVPVLRWPDALRAVRGRCTLELAGDGLAQAAPLADALLGVHALPRGR